METKMRIKLFDTDWKLQSDRLVEQEIEFRKGPQDKHEGPIVVEFTLGDKAACEEAMLYLSKLCLDLPLILTKEKSTRRSLNKLLMSDKEPLLDLLKEVLSKNKNQDDLLENLRGLGFKLNTFEFLNSLEITGDSLSSIKETIREDWFFASRLIKEAKNPTRDKYDLRLVFAFKMQGDLKERVYVYFCNELYEGNSVTLPWKNTNKIGFKKPKVGHKFPPTMVEEERDRWRKEDRLYEKDPTLEKSKFYLRWAQYINTL